MKHMFLSFINSNSKWYEDHTDYSDALKENSFIEWFLNEFGFDGALKNHYDYDKLADLRQVLNEALDNVVSAGGLSEEQFGKIGNYLSLSQMNYCLQAEGGNYKLGLKPVKCDWNYVMGEIAASFIKALNGSDVNRLRRCENPDCRSAFYDSSRNLARRWCCNACSSLIKVRRYRQKQHQA